MTVKQESAYISYKTERTECGRCACVIVYTNEECVLCDAALEIMYNVISDFGLSPSVIREVDITRDDDDGCGLPAPVGLPAVRICEEFMSGLPDMDEARGAVMHAVLKNCFSDNSCH
ncbi:MAG: hypothetical protein ACXAC0_09860 [Candidatus Thorarchaeota archaeon]